MQATSTGADIIQLVTKLKKQPQFHLKYCTAGCGQKTSHSCVKCKEVVQLDPCCWNIYHENLQYGVKAQRVFILATATVTDSNTTTNATVQTTNM
eukprot:15346451-Ditylum_brightwellii.AAC.1